MTNSGQGPVGVANSWPYLFVLGVIVRQSRLHLPSEAFEQGVTSASGEAGVPRALVVSLRAEPKTLNLWWPRTRPHRKSSAPCKRRWVHINRRHDFLTDLRCQVLKVSSDGLDYTLTLRQGLRFSDGEPRRRRCSITLRVYLDEGVHAPSVTLLITVSGPNRLTVSRLTRRRWCFIRQARCGRKGCSTAWHSCRGIA